MARQRDKFVTLTLKPTLKSKTSDKIVILSLKSTLNGETTGQICHIDFKVDFKKRDKVTNLSHCL